MGDNMLTHFLSSFIAVSIRLYLCVLGVSGRFTGLFCAVMNCSSAGRLRYSLVSTSGRAEDEADELKGRVHGEWIRLFFRCSPEPFIPLFLPIHLLYSPSVSLFSGGVALLARNCQAGSAGVLQGKNNFIGNIYFCSLLQVFIIISPFWIKSRIVFWCVVSHRPVRVELMISEKRLLSLLSFSDEILVPLYFRELCNSNQMKLGG